MTVTTFDELKFIISSNYLVIICVDRRQCEDCFKCVESLSRLDTLLCEMEHNTINDNFVICNSMYMEQYGCFGVTNDHISVWDRCGPSHNISYAKLIDNVCVGSIIVVNPIICFDDLQKRLEEVYVLKDISISKEFPQFNYRRYIVTLKPLLTKAAIKG